MDKKSNIVKLKITKEKETITENGKVSLIENKYLHVIVPITELDSKNINKTNDLTKSVRSTLKEEKIITKDEDIVAVYHVGKLSEFTGYNELVYEFPRTRRQILAGKDTMFRDYSQSLESQKDILWLVNTCSNMMSSWRSAVKKCNSEYVMIIKTLIKT